MKYHFDLLSKLQEVVVFIHAIANSPHGGVMKTMAKQRYLAVVCKFLFLLWGYLSYKVIKDYRSIFKFSGI